MPDIGAAGTFTKDTANWGVLASTLRERAIMIDGSSVGTSLTLGYVDDQGTTRTIEGGEVAALPYSKNLKAGVDLVITAVGATDVNVTIKDASTG